MKKLFLIPLIIVLAVGLVFSGCAEPAPEAPPEAPPGMPPGAPPGPPPGAPPADVIKILYGSFDMETAPDAIIVKEWAQELEEKSGGQVKVEYSWNSALGMMPQYYDLVVSGVCDMAPFMTMMRPGLHPIFDMGGLPWNLQSAVPATKGIYALYEAGYLDKEFGDVKVAILNGHQPGVFMSNKPIETVADIDGLLIHAGNEVQSNIIKGLGGTPTNVPPMDIYAALQKGTVDATTGEPVMLKSLNLIEVVDYVSPGFGIMNLGYLMNMNTWNKLPADVQAIIDDISMKYGLKMAEYFDQENADTLNLFQEKGGQLYQWSEADIAAMDELFPSIWSDYITASEEKGTPMAEAVELFWNTLKEDGVEKPAIAYTPGS